MENLVRTIASGGSANQYPWIGALLRDLQQHRGASIVIAGENQPPIIHALAHSMNDALGNVGKTVFYSEPLQVNPVDQRGSLQELIGDIDAGRVELLVIIGGNPVYNTPPDLKLDFNRLQKAKLRVHLSEYKDETTELCHWHVPAAHYLESWGDARSYDGTVTIVQPLIEPLYEGKTVYELLAVFSDQYDRRPYDVVRAYWQQQQPRIAAATAQGAATQPSPRAANQAQPATGATQTTQAPAGETTPQSQTSQQLSDFETWWRQSVHDGFIPNTALQTKSVAVNNSFMSQPAATHPAGAGFELVMRTDP
jgi:molybdopterin-containing oxidoreductase family iron-sulfur binding subunit